MSETETVTRPRALVFAAVALWVVTAALAVAAVAKIAMYGQFTRSSADACDAVVALEPPGGWADASFPCEQLGPMGWYLPYWAAACGYVLFGALFLTAAILASRARPGARAFTAVTGIFAVASTGVMGLLNVGWTFAIRSSNDADELVAERVREAVPVWLDVTETTVQIILIVGWILAFRLLFGYGAGAYLRRR
jgi:hypothetical protein